MLVIKLVCFLHFFMFIGQLFKNDASLVFQMLVLSLVCGWVLFWMLTVNRGTVIWLFWHFCGKSYNRGIVKSE